MSTILVVDDNPICREPIAEALRSNGYDVVCAADGVEALALLQQEPPDVLLLDVNMPELNGHAVLRAMRGNPKLTDLPVIMLTDRAEREHVAAAAEHRVQGYLLKSQFSIDELFARVDACLGVAVAVPADGSQTAGRRDYARWRDQFEQPPTETASPASPPAPPNRTPSESAGPVSPYALDLLTVKSLDDLSPAITKKQLVKLVNEGLKLRPLGPTVQNVMAITGSAGCSAEDVAKAVTHDQALSIRILKLANSSAYSRGRTIENVKEAVARIGIQEVRSMVMVLGVLQQYEGGAGQHVDPRLFWEHSIACGLIASTITKDRHAAKTDDSFLWGMLHDVGRLILLDHVADPYGYVWDAAEHLSLPLEAVEAKLMLLDHCEILEKALEHWQFPREFIAPVVNHHRTNQSISRLGPRHYEGAATIAIADRLAHALLLGNSGNAVIYPFDDLVDGMQMKPETIARLTKAIPDQTRDLKITMLSRTNDDSWPDYAAQTKERLGMELRPVCVSAKPEVDAYRIFCERIASPSDDKPPNLGVVYLRNADELKNLTARFDAEEQSRGAANMPVVVVCAKGKVPAGQPWLHSRRHAVVTAPVRIPDLVGTIQKLLS